MIGLINRSIEIFLKETYGAETWEVLCQATGLDPRGFSSLKAYPDELTSTLLRAAAQTLNKSALDLLEDTGSWLVRREPIRRLLRFSGSEFEEFVFALEELPGRARMALAVLDFPPIVVLSPEKGSFEITGTGWLYGLEWIIAGALRGMADDFGVLALMEAEAGKVSLKILVPEYSPARPFDLVRPLERAR